MTHDAETVRRVSLAIKKAHFVHGHDWEQQAIAVLDTVQPTVQEAAKVLADHINSNMTDVNEIVSGIDVTLETPVRHWFAQIVERIGKQAGEDKT